MQQPRKKSQLGQPARKTGVIRAGVPAATTHQQETPDWITPGNVTARPVPGFVPANYVPPSAPILALREQLQETGISPKMTQRSRQEIHEALAADGGDRNRMAALSALCLVALLLAWVGAAHFWPPAYSYPLYALSYTAGGFQAARRALRDLRAGKLNVDLLMVLAAAGAAAVNEWPEGAILLFLFSLSNTLEAFVLGRTRRAIEALMDLSPDEATLLRDGQEQRVPVEALELGDVIRVRPGERIAADGCVTDGHSSVDQSPMTGESVPVEKAPGSPVFAATLNGGGALDISVTARAGDSTLSRIVRLVEEAQSEKAPSQRFTDWFGQRYTIGVLVAAMLAVAIPMVFFRQPFDVAFYRAMTLLVVASPCAVVISIPAAIMAAIAGAARNGVLFKGGAHLEELAKIRAIAFDKTGTLTVGSPRLTDLRPAPGHTFEEVLQLAASAESQSEHPLARAVVRAAAEHDLELMPAHDTEALVGRGLQARIGDRLIMLGKPELWLDRGLKLPANLADAECQLASQGKTTVWAGDENGVLGLLAIADTLRPEAAETMARLQAAGVKHLTMLTGDSHRVAANIAGQLRMSFRAGLMPADKLSCVKSLREQHTAVAMVGDGINDAPSLAAADLGISLGGTGTDVALETADIVLMADGLGRLPYAIALAQQTQRIIWQNLAFAFSTMALLVAATLYGKLRLPFAVLGHEGTTVLVILNGVRLLGFKIRKPVGPVTLRQRLCAVRRWYRPRRGGRA